MTMANQDEFFIDRMRAVLKENRTMWTEKNMFGGKCFMVDDKMCFGAYKGGLMARVHPDEIPALVKRPGAGQMILGDKHMAGYLLIEPEGYDMDEDLDFWIGKCLEFNPLAKASKKRVKK